MILLLPLASCAPPVQNGEDGNITILLPGGSGGRYAISGEERDQNLVYILDFSSSGGESRRVETSPGEANVTLFLTLGSWTVRAEAFHNGELFGTGEARFTVRGGRNDPVKISMTPLSGNGFLSAIDDEDFDSNPVVDKMFKVDSADKWNKAVADIQDGGDNKNYVITLTGDFSIGGLSSTDWSFGSASGIKVSLRGAHTLSLTEGTQGCLLWVNGGQTLILRDLTLKGHTTNYGPLVYVGGSGASLSMKAGTTIKGNTNTNGGGGVFVDGGSFTMDGGVISGNSSTGSGGGVFVVGGSFSKSGGIIYGDDAIGDDANGVPLKNTASGNTKGHAVYVSGKYRDITALAGDDIDTTDHGTGLFAAMIGINAEDFGDFALIPKPITVNGEEDWNAALTAISGGGNGKNYIITLTLGAIGSFLRVRTNQTLILRDLTLTGITANNAALVSVDGSASLSMKAGTTIKGNTNTNDGGGMFVGGGVYVDNGGSFTMEDGVISGNTASFGSGVAVYGGTFTMQGGEISGNTADESGGGVAVTNFGSFTMSGGVISSNPTGSGGGVYVNYGTFIMNSGATISGNTATDSGGGVYINIGGSFTMGGGVISGNSSAYRGGGVYVLGTFTKTGGGIIYGDMDNNHTAGADENTAATGPGHSVWYADDSGIYYCNDDLDSGDDISTSDTMPTEAGVENAVGYWTKQ